MTANARTSSEPWRRLTIAVVGGDEREQEICRLAAASGAVVKAFGFPWPSGGIDRVALASDAAEALTGANITLMPIPGIAVDGSLFATTKIIPTESLLRAMAPAAHIILGRADDRLRQTAARLGIKIHEYEADQELMLLRAPAIVEGVIRVLIENTAVTIHGAQICVVGQGNTGSVLTRTLLALGARVTVAARNPVQRASAFTLGATPLPLEDLPGVAGTFDILVSTASALVVTSTVIDRLRPNSIVVDMASPPGSCDLDYATRSGRKAIWARALGRRAPITVGASQWQGIARIIDAILAESTANAG
jgi:dipicolinate synthase subunit A